MSDSREKVSGLALTPAMAREVYTCISMRIAYIETGDPVLRATDAVRCGKRELINALSSQQMQLILDLEKVMSACLKVGWEHTGTGPEPGEFTKLVRGEFPVEPSPEPVVRSYPRTRSYFPGASEEVVQARSRGRRKRDF